MIQLLKVRRYIAYIEKGPESVRDGTCRLKHSCGHDRRRFFSPRSFDCTFLVGGQDGFIGAAFEKSLAATIGLA
jgi:hypothetical protein